MRNFGRWSRTAVCSSTGIVTSPKEIEPFQMARGMVDPLPGVTSSNCICKVYAGLARKLTEVMQRKTESGSW